MKALQYDKNDCMKLLKKDGYNGNVMKWKNLRMVSF